MTQAEIEAAIGRARDRMQREFQAYYEEVKRIARAAEDAGGTCTIQTKLEVDIRVEGKTSRADGDSGS